MTQTGALQVALLMRCPQPGQYSVETVFAGLPDLLPEDINARVVLLPRQSQGLRNRLHNLAFARRVRADVIHVTGDVTYCALAVSRRRCALTVLDLVSVRRLRGWRRQVLILLWYKLPVWWARSVTTISPTIRDELALLLPNSAAKTQVIGCPGMLRADGATAGTGQRRSRRRVLQVGTGPNKNLELVAEALSGLGAELRIVGRLSRAQVEMLDGLALNYTAIFDLSGARLVDEYLDADVLVYASTYEGFGLPIVEAQTLGVPVITSNIDPMTWVAGDGALFVDPHDKQAIRTSVAAVLDSADLRERLTGAGHANAHRFAPERIAALYGELYRRVAEPRRPVRRPGA